MQVYHTQCRTIAPKSQSMLCFTFICLISLMLLGCAKKPAALPTSAEQPTAGFLVRLVEDPYPIVLQGDDATIYLGRMNYFW